MSADGPLTLRWHEFSSNMASTSASFRTREAFTDLTLVVENSKVGASLAEGGSRYEINDCQITFGANNFNRHEKGFTGLRRLPYIHSIS